MSESASWNLVEHGGLIVPQSYVDASEAEKASVCNGCGTAGWKGKLVPETMWGLRISEACQVHDWMYREGKTESDKVFADMLFLRNLLRMINAHGGWLKVLRRYRAMSYYNAVAEAGNAAFWAGKDKVLQSTQV